MLYHLYNNTIDLHFDEKAHKYTINGKGIDGVSTSIKILAMDKVDDWAVNLDFNKFQELWDAGLNWKDAFRQAKKFHASERDGRADLGTNVHKVIEYYVKSRIRHQKEDPETKWTTQPGMDLTKQEGERFMLFVHWAEDNVASFVDSERPVYSKKYKYCGTLDFTCYLKGHKELFVGDIKNAKYIYPKNFLQTAAYEGALKEETGQVIEGRVIVRIGDDHIETIKREDFKTDYASFLAALRLSRWYNKIQKELLSYAKR